MIEILQTCDGCGATRVLTDLTQDKHLGWREVGTGSHLCKACIDVALEGR